MNGAGRVTTKPSGEGRDETLMAEVIEANAKTLVTYMNSNEAFCGSESPFSGISRRTLPAYQRGLPKVSEKS